MDLLQLNSIAAPTGFFIFEDFIRAGTVATGDSLTGTAITSGTLATNAASGGWARLSGAATTDNSGYQVQALGAFPFTEGKPVIFKTRIKLGESTSTNGPTESDLFAGLFPVDTSIEASLPDNGIYFVKAEGATTIACVVRVSATSTSVTLSSSVYTAADDATVELAIIIWPGAASGSNSRVQFAINGAVVDERNNINLPAATVYMTPTIAYQTGDNTGTKWVDVDYISCVQTKR